MVNQVPVIGILMIVNGSLVTLLGVLIAIIGPVMFSFIGAAQGPQGAPIPQEAQQVLTVVSVFYVIYGSIIAIVGIMNIAGGISALRFRSRNFVIAALFFNIAALCSYCFPTSLGLLIWGLIVMFQGDVAYAFSLGASGYTADEIRQRMGSGVYRREDYRRDNWDEREGGREPKVPKPPPKGPPGEGHIYGAGEPQAKPQGDKLPPKPGAGDEGIFEK